MHFALALESRAPSFLEFGAPAVTSANSQRFVRFMADLQAAVLCKHQSVCVCVPLHCVDGNQNENSVSS